MLSGGSSRASRGNFRLEMIYRGLYHCTRLVDETHNWDEDELLELVVTQFGDCEAEPWVHRVLPDEWNGVTEVEHPAGEANREKLGNGS